uniref:Nuclear receptor n=1 Tax=Tigriopus japonicus TaxID=158387 RepID=A0A0A7CKA4_TIGJA|nr:nuclear receptor [Tigriopus japonicus]
MFLRIAKTSHKLFRTMEETIDDTFMDCQDATEPHLDNLDPDHTSEDEEYMGGFSDPGEGPSEQNDVRMHSSGKKCKKENPLISDTEKCRVCGEPAARHVHYGSVTCFSCRAFFRRSIQNKAWNNYSCRRQGQCEIMLKSRKNCQKCRYEECLSAGMKPTWVLSEEERSRRFRKTREKKARQNSTRKSNEGSEPETNNGQGNEDDQIPGSSKLDTRTHSTLHGSTHAFDNSGRIIEAEALSAPKPGHLPPSANQAVMVSSGMAHNWGRCSKTPPNVMFTPAMEALIKSKQGNDSSSGLVQQMSLGRDPTAGASYSFKQADLMFYDYNPTRKDTNRSPSTCSSSRSPYSSRSYSPHEAFPQRFSPGIPLEPQMTVSEDEIIQIRRLSYEHDKFYRSVAFGEELIKELVMCSVFGLPLSPNQAMTAYRLMIQRVTKVAQGFEPFNRLDRHAQKALLKTNADLMVSLRGGVFFDEKKKGIDQILFSLGVDDVDLAKRMLMTTLKATGSLGRIEYKNYNSIQELGDNDTEHRYNALLSRVGSVISLVPELVNVMAYVLLLCPDYCELEDRRKVEGLQQMMIHMTKRLLESQYPTHIAMNVFPQVLSCVSDLRELTLIKRKRPLAKPITKSPPHIPETPTCESSPEEQATAGSSSSLGDQHTDTCLNESAQGHI